MAPSIPSVDEKQTAEYAASPINAPDPDAQYGGHEERKKLEKKLLMKIDLRHVARLTGKWLEITDAYYLG
ncbi:sugar transporter [Moniliophthora roreri]|nr:sugar transporter [Moniliophthora roreri]